MTKRVGMEVSIAVAEMVKMADVDVVAVYPITPQTHVVEHLAELVADGELDAEYIPVESEHSAMSACLGSSAAGARTFTATSSQGLELKFSMKTVRTSSTTLSALSESPKTETFCCPSWCTWTASIFHMSSSRCFSLKKNR